MIEGTNAPSERVILVVDDAAPAAAALEVVLGNIGDTRVHTASNGAAAWKFLQSGDGSRVCAVVTDLEMPLVDGFELIRRIRSSPSHAGVPVIVVSGTTETTAAARALEAGANAFFGKPWSAGRMRAALERFVYEKDGNGS